VGADAAAPARADDADIDLFHFTNLLLTIDWHFAHGRWLTPPAAKYVLSRLSLDHCGLRGTNRDLLC
jgi:hypothetical protein